MADSISKEDPPLVDVKVTNPVTYIKRWWRKIIGNEGIEFRFHIRPLTAILMAAAIASVGFGVGRFTMPFNIPFFKINPSPITTSTPEPWKETAYVGTLKFTNATGKYYLLITSSSEAITLNVPPSINLESLVGRRIFATGRYNKTSRVLVISDASDMEILPIKPVPIPTIEPITTPLQTPEATLPPISPPVY